MTMVGMTRIAMRRKPMGKPMRIAMTSKPIMRIAMTRIGTTRMAKRNIRYADCDNSDSYGLG